MGSHTKKLGLVENQHTETINAQHAQHSKTKNYILNLLTQQTTASLNASLHTHKSVSFVPFVKGASMEAAYETSVHRIMIKEEHRFVEYLFGGFSIGRMYFCQNE